MEVGWYLRFSTTGKVEVLADHKSLPQLEGQLHVLPEWDMQVRDQGDHILASFTRTR